MLRRSSGLVAVVAALAWLGLAPGCQPERAAPSRASASAAPASSAADGAMCSEHGVLEAVCTRCSPALVPVFKAKGDWCAQHDFPESFCPLCHPERGGRPARDVGSSGSAPGDGPADGTRIRFKTRDIARQAGIQTSKAELRESGGGVLATAKLAYDATKLAVVNARSPGVVRAVEVDVGAVVKRGAVLARLESADVGANRARLKAAEARIELAQKTVERQRALSREGVGATKDLQESEREVQAARAEHAAVASALSVAGAGGGAGGGYTLIAPLAGVVTRRNATVGKLVAVEELLFEVVDTSSMWADLDVPEIDLGAVATGQRVELTIDGLAGKRFDGAITFVSPEVDAHTRTVTARVPLANPAGVLRANMYGHARIVVGGDRASVLVPEAAVQRAKSVQLVFVKRADDEFEARRVEVGVREGGRFEITKGLRSGEEVATVGSFLLKTETLKESIGAGCCEVK